MVKQCPTCCKSSRPRKEPMIPTELPTYPFQKVGTDLFYFKGTTYLLVVDYFSRYPEIKKLSNTTTNCLITALKEIFSRFRIPETVVSDNGPQYSSQEFAAFASTYDFSHVTISPHFPQSNGQAERTVQTVKLLKESSDPYMALLTYRSTPFPWCCLLPAELLMGRRLRANIPLLSEQLEIFNEFRRKNHVFEDKQKRDFNRHHGTRSLSLLPDDTDVWITSGETGTKIQPPNRLCGLYPGRGDME